MRIKSALILIMAIVLVSDTLGQVRTEGTAKEPTDDPLKPLLFLVGEWKGQGKGPYGPFDTEGRFERRGRWLLYTEEVFVPGTRQRIHVSTWVYGHDEKGGLLCYLFDTAGVFRFAGRKEADGVVAFHWSEGSDWRRFRFERQPDASVRSRYEAHLPSQSERFPGYPDATFEGVMRPKSKVN